MLEVSACAFRLREGQHHLGRPGAFVATHNFIACTDGDPFVQTLGGRFQVDGRLQGEENVQTISCDQTANACQIRVPAPGAALVYFSDDAQSAASAPGQDAQTFPTTVLTKTKNTVSIDPAVLATAQGMSGKDRQQQGGTSQGGANGATAVAVGARPWMLVVTGAAMGLALCSRRLALAW